ncbi:unnamed protein product [Merluccius merluccius]
MISVQSRLAEGAKLDGVHLEPNVDSTQAQCTLRFEAAVGNGAQWPVGFAVQLSPTASLLPPARPGQLVGSR